MARIELIFLDGEKQEFHIDSSSFIIGRGKSCDIVLPMEGFSRQHAKIDIENGEVFVTDLGSINGVLIDGLKIIPHQKTPYQTFLNLQFGPLQSCSVYLEKEGMTSSFKTITGDFQIKQVRSDDDTKTMVTPKVIRQKVGNKKVLRKVESPKKSVGLAPVILILAILGGGVYYQFYMNEETQVVSETAPPGEVVKPVESKFETVSSLQEKLGKQNCSGEFEKICTSLSLQTDKGEGIIQNGQNLVVMVNLDRLMKAKYTPEFLNLNKTDQEEILLLQQLATGSFLVTLGRQKDFSNIQLVGLVNSDTGTKPDIILKINRDYDTKKLNHVTLDTILDQALNLGKLDLIDVVRSQYSITLP